MEATNPWRAASPTDQITPFRLTILGIIGYRGDPNGLEIQRDLEEIDLTARPGRLYPNLDRLVEKGEHDGRTNAYRVTSAGAALLGDLGSWLADAAEEASIQSV